MASNIGWFVLYVKSRHEKKVHFQLQKIGIDSFLPMFYTIVQWSDRKKKVLKPLFPSYVFVRINSPTEFYKALSVNGACSYIRFGKEYAKVTKKEIDHIKILISDKSVTNVKIKNQLPKVGDIIKIALGPLSGLDCEVLKIGNENKIIVQLNSLNINITATIPKNYFEELLSVSK